MLPRRLFLEDLLVRRMIQSPKSYTFKVTLPEVIFKFLEKRTASSSRGYLLEATLLKNYFQVPVKRVTWSQRVYLLKDVVRKIIPKKTSSSGRRLNRLKVISPKQHRKVHFMKIFSPSLEDHLVIRWRLLTKQTLGDQQ